ncbi:competence protein CoiA family protein [Oceanimonas smirnovii]|uniref:Competence protein CoiA family protein n=1 Tax=Oceanimonas smirnovii TaxID=264574 RepID=A0ABW7P3K3_9GAMM
MSGKTLIPFAIRDADQQIVSAEEVESGLGCQCHCPSCHGVLIARKGQHKAHHFSHHKGSERDCAFAFETSIRLMLLDKLDRINSLSTPALRIDGFHKPVCTGKTLAVSHVPSSGPAEGPTALYQVGNDARYRLGIYLPPAGTCATAPPPWLADYTERYGCTGVLAVDYGVFATLMFKAEKPGSLNSIGWLLQIMSTHPKCLHWLYHPRAKKMRAEREAKKKRDAELRQRYQQQQPQQKPKPQPQQPQSPQFPPIARPRQVAPVRISAPTQPKRPGICKHCRLDASDISPEGYCYRQACMDSRKLTQSAAANRR